MKLKPGMHCKACDAPLTSDCLDAELCNTCIGVVNELNKQYEFDPEEDEEIV